MGRRKGLSLASWWWMVIKYLEFETDTLTYSFKLLTPIKEEARLLRVGDLIDRDRGSWNKQLILSLFLPIDFEVILNTPLCSSWPPNTLRWHFSSTGELMVETTYQLITCVQNKDKFESSGDSAQSFWKSSWIWFWTIYDRVLFLSNEFSFSSKKKFMVMRILYIFYRHKRTMTIRML